MLVVTRASRRPGVCALLVVTGEVRQHVAKKSLDHYSTRYVEPLRDIFFSFYHELLISSRSFPTQVRTFSNAERHWRTDEHNQPRLAAYWNKQAQHSHASRPASMSAHGPPRAQSRQRAAQRQAARRARSRRPKRGHRVPAATSPRPCSQSSTSTPRKPTITSHLMAWEDDCPRRPRG